jgi:hypothetical protein
MRSGGTERRRCDRVWRAHGVADLHALRRRGVRSLALAGCRGISGLAGQRRAVVGDSKIKG